MEDAAPMTLEDWHRGGRSRRHRGHPVFYRDDGSGPVVLCVHGFPTASWDWSRVWPTLTERFRVVAPDMMGFGFSAKPSGYDYSICDQASLHEELLADVGVHEAHVLAHDYGDTVAQELLARHDERLRAGKAGIAIRSICFLNGGLFPEAHRARTVQKLLRTPLGPLLARLMNERAFRRSFAAVFGPSTQPSEQELHDFWTLVSRDGGHRIAHKLIRYIDERRRHRERWVGVLRTTGVPLRLIDGPADPVSGAHMAERYREVVPSPDVVLLEGIGHYPQVEDPKGVLDGFLELVDRIEAGS